MDKFEDISNKIKEPAYRAELMQRIDKNLQSLYNIPTEGTTCPVELTIQLDGMQALRYRVIMVYLKDLIGLTDEEAHEFIFNQGIEKQIQILGSMRKNILEDLGILEKGE